MSKSAGNTVTAAVIQMVSGKDVDQNLTQAQQLIEEAAKQNPQIIVLPEMFVCLGVKNQRAIAESRMTADDVLKPLQAWAKAANSYLVAGSLPFVTPACEESKVKASSFVFSPDGEQIARYDKIHLFDVDVADNKGSYRESDTFSPGEAPVTVELPFAKMGLSVCYDLRFPELYQHYMSAQCTLLTAPSAFTHKTGEAHWETLIKARAIETQSFMLAANQGGKHEDGRETWGHSMIVDPWGTVLAEVSEMGPGIAHAELHFDQLAAIRQSMPIAEHKKLR